MTDFVDVVLFFRKYTYIFVPVSILIVVFVFHPRFFRNLIDSYCKLFKYTYDEKKDEVYKEIKESKKRSLYGRDIEI
jgi:hypothetical protein